MAVPRPDEFITAPRPVADVAYKGMLMPGEGFGVGTMPGTGRISGVATNIPSAQASLEALGVAPQRQMPRPQIPNLMSTNTGPALSEQQQAFLAGDRERQASSPLPRPEEVAAAERARKAQEMQGRKDFALQMAGEPGRVAGAEARKTEEVRQTGRVQLAERKGAIKSALQDRNISSKEKMAHLDRALEQALSESEMASRSGDVQAKIQADKDIANINNSARLEQLKARGELDAAQATTDFINQARLQAQREGNDLRRVLLQAAGDPFVHESISDYMTEQGINNLIAEASQPVATQPATATPALAEAERDYDMLKRAFQEEKNEGRKLTIKRAMDRAKAEIIQQ